MTIMASAAAGSATEHLHFGSKEHTAIDGSGERAGGLGRFRSALLDERATLTPARPAAEARVRCRRAAVSPNLERTNRRARNRPDGVSGPPSEAG